MPAHVLTGADERARAAAAASESFARARRVVAVPGRMDTLDDWRWFNEALTLIEPTVSMVPRRQVGPSSIFASWVDTWRLSLTTLRTPSNSEIAGGLHDS